MLETAQRNVQEDDLRALLTLYEVPAGEWETYLHAAREARKRGWWENDARHTLDESMRLYVGLEQGAHRQRSYQPGLFHGLLQTPDYTTAVIRQSYSPISEEMIARHIDQRALRQRVLMHDSQPLEVWTVMDESVLKRVMGRPGIMAAQLAHLADVAVTYSHVTMQVVPLDQGGGFAAHHGAFSILNFPWDSDPGLVYVEQRPEARFLESLPVIDSYSVLFEQLVRIAASPADSLGLILMHQERHARNQEKETK